MSAPGAEEPVAREGARGAVVRVVVADDQAVVREGIVMLLGLLPGVEVVGAARDGEEAVALTAELGPDVVLMDLRMPRCDGVEATRRIREQHPGTEVVVLTTYADDDSLFPALRAGARGYLTKDAGGEEIVRALRDVTDGRAGLSPGVQRRLLEQLLERGTGPAGEPMGGAPVPGRGRPESGQGVPGASGAPRDGGEGAAVPEGVGGLSGAQADGLTERETEVIVLVADGLSNQEIASRLRISTATVKTHINNLFAKTGVRDRAQAVRYAYQHGLVRAPGRRVT
ncbi:MULTISPECIES: response regulator transcription factor [unclassified Streptomyces]|uniref:response regulator n=1 Tax=unclassified Streptomyces TaxID=2593676 RepID=UPI0006F35BD7|nr:MULTISPECIES: response regulator transcription factor [unclassified Streptomyces]KQX56198.1 LuxR family transcriptional regulator [Streptomyces sp. Root1304]KRA97014.1 LuxR family transcriptional regulator [Streptomyces sp. Root66D1]